MLCGGGIRSRNREGFCGFEDEVQEADCNTQRKSTLILEIFCHFIDDFKTFSEFLITFQSYFDNYFKND